MALLLAFSCTRRERSRNSGTHKSEKRITEREDSKKRRGSETRKSEKRITEKDDSEKKDSDKPKQHLAPSIPPGDGKFTGSEIFEKYNSAVFVVYASSGMSGKQGSGFFVNDSGLAVSNHHVFSGTSSRSIKLTNGQTFNVAKIIAQSEKDDYIIFQVNLGFRCNYIPVTNRKPNVGEKVFAIGSPLGFENTFSSGEISQLRRDSIQISVPIDHGSSGGALINEYGEVIGITTSKVEGTSANLNFAKDINLLKDKLDLIH
ncbi:serine protease [bacterium]|nr:serine protease [bacterium]